MSEKILLLGYDSDGGLALAKELAGLGYQPAAAPWQDFSCRAYGRNRPALILADVDQPRAVPLEDLCRETRRKWGEDYPVVAMSKASKVHDVALLLDAGAAEVLPPKPPAELLGRKLTRCLARRGGRAAQPRGELAEDAPPPALFALFRRRELVRLGDLASVYPGAMPRRTTFRRMAPPDQDWRGVSTADGLHRFSLGKPTAFLRWSRVHLFRRPSAEEYDVREKVVVRRAGPPVVAAIDRSGVPAGPDVYSIVPREGIPVGFLACVLNSRLLDFYFNRMAGVPEDGRLRLEDLRDMPLPRPSEEASLGLTRAAALLTHYGPNPQSWIDRQSKEEQMREMEEAVFALYGAGTAALSELAALHF